METIELSKFEVECLIKYIIKANSFLKKVQAEHTDVFDKCIDTSADTFMPPSDFASFLKDLKNWVEEDIPVAGHDSKIDFLLGEYERVFHNYEFCMEGLSTIAQYNEQLQDENLMNIIDGIFNNLVSAPEEEE